MLKKKISASLSRQFPLLMEWCKYKFDNDDRWLLRKEILKYYDTHPQGEKDNDLQKAIAYIRKKGVQIFPYPFIEKYKTSHIKVYTDASCNLKYVIHNNYRLYFERGMNEFRVQRTYANLLHEQDPQAAHCYQTQKFDIEDGDILFDVGAAEGIFSLTVIDRVSKIYLFEVEEKWIEPLRKTFEPWQDKVEVIHKYVSNQDSDTTVKIDTITKDLEGKSLFLKLDVEGVEKLVIEGAETTLTSPLYTTKAAICTYHNAEDHAELSQIMTQKQYQVETSPGYMLFIYRKLEPPYFRRGMIHCRKTKAISE